MYSTFLVFLSWCFFWGVVGGWFVLLVDLFLQAEHELGYSEVLGMITPS